mmetsp:Transcript_26069/g.39456  ORF Transcript_26069/g.39456 Transcript_26069/m.39456 type:complete len:373 (+) Transcript_26069:144-1262(+)
MVSMLTAKQRQTQTSTNQIITRGFTGLVLFLVVYLLLITGLAKDHSHHENGLNVQNTNSNIMENQNSLRAKTTTNDDDKKKKKKKDTTTGDEISISTTTTKEKKTKQKAAKPAKIPFLFVHINKTGGTSLIRMLNNNCEDDEYVYENWKHRSVEDGKMYYHRSFHATAHSYIALHGREVWDEAFTFAVVRHPLARQVSNFFFLLENCEEEPEDCEEGNNDRLIPYGKGVTTHSSTDEEKIEAFHKWMKQLYKAYPPGSRDQYLFGSKGHGNEEYLTFNSTQTSWLVNEQGDMVVERVIKLEDLSTDMTLLSERIPCLKNAQNGNKLIKKNKTSKYPSYTRFANNAYTNKIMKEIYSVDYKNFGYDFDVEPED